MKVLIVEDESGIARTLDQYLRREGFLTELAATGRAAVSSFRHARPDLVLLDVMLPELDGFEVLRVIRQDGAVPVIMLTARTDEVDRLVGLGLGADDYVVKPFSFREVVARVKAVLRRTQGVAEPAAKVLRVGALSVDPGSATATFTGHPLDLTATEFKLLSQFAGAPNRVFNRGELIERALPDSDILERTLDSHIKNLRAKLQRCGASDIIQTVRGLGFRLVEAQVGSRPPTMGTRSGTQVTTLREVPA
ncbi:MAG TPA: response regulator transcription factor [Trueperaceae bacterium]|nr:response regulator transcription factor [Trueperaceae bacterium]